MNVLVCNNFVRQGSGVDACARMEVRALGQHGHRVRVFGVDNAVLDRSGGLTEASILASTLYSLPAKAALHRLLSADRYNVAYLHNTVPLLTGSIYDALHKHNVFTVQHLHNYRAFCLSSYAYRGDKPCDLCMHTAFTACAAYRCYRDSFVASAALTGARLVDCARARRSGYGADAYVANSAFTKQKHVQHGFDDDRIWVLHNPSEDVASLLDDGAAPADRRKLLTFVGSLLRAKGVYAVLDLAAAMPDWEVQLVGAGPEEPGLRRQVAARRLDNVQLEGLLAGAAKARAWRDSFVTLVPSLWDEPFGLVVPESYSLGIPVLSSGTGGMAETIRDGATGFFESFRDPAETARLLRALFDDRPRYVAMCRAARSLYEAEFTEKVFADRLELLQATIMGLYRPNTGPRSTLSRRAAGRRTYLRTR